MIRGHKQKWKPSVFLEGRVHKCGVHQRFPKCSAAHNGAAEHACTELRQWRDFKSRISKHLLTVLRSDSWPQRPVLRLPPHILMGCGNAKCISTYHMSCGNSPVPEWYGNYLYFCARHVWGGVSRAYRLQAPGKNWYAIAQRCVILKQY